MQFSPLPAHGLTLGFGLSLALGLVAAAPTSAPDLAPQVVSAITTIANDTTALNATLNTFQPDSLLGALTALQIQKQTSALSSSLTNAASLANQSATWDDLDSFDVGVAILNLEPSIFSVLSNIVVKKPAFATAVLFVGDLSQTVEPDLQQQQELSRELGDAIGAKLASSVAGQAPTITDNIVQHFQQAIQAYQACTGLICLPNLGGLGGL